MTNVENRTRTLMLVEDHSDQRKTYYDVFQDNGWKVIPAQSAGDAIYKFEIEMNARRRVDVIMLDMGLPPLNDDPKYGVKLAQDLRAIDPDVPMLAYTGMSLDPEEMAEVVAKLLPIRVSFVSVRHISHLGLNNVLNLVANQFFILDAQSSLALTDTVAQEPDPFADIKYWQCLHHLSQGKSYKLIAREVDLSEDGVRKRMQNIKEILESKNLVQIDPDRHDLIQWYQDNMMRYRHFEALNQGGSSRRLNY